MLWAVRDGFADSLVGQMCEEVGDSEKGAYVLICNDDTSGREFVAFEYYEMSGWHVALICMRDTQWLEDAVTFLKQEKPDLAAGLKCWIPGA